MAKNFACMDYKIDQTLVFVYKILTKMRFAGDKDRKNQGKTVNVALQSTHCKFNLVR